MFLYVLHIALRKQVIGSMARPMFLGGGNRSKMKMARRCLQTFKNKGFQANCEAIRNALLKLSKLRKSIKYSCSSLFFSVGSMDFVPTAFGWLLMPFGEVNCQKV